MDWIKHNYDRVLIGIFATVLFLCAGWTIWNSVNFTEQFSERNSTKKPDNTIVSPAIQAIDQALAITAEPRLWSGHEGSLFVSRPYVLKDGKLVDPLEDGNPLHPPIQNAWLIKYNLDYAAPDIKEQDADQDHFSNLEEFLAQTDPTNDRSIPPYHTKLRLVKFDPKPFRLKFSGTPDDGQTFTINTRDLKGRTQFLKLGDTIKGAPYKVLSYEPKKTTRHDVEVDISELTIQNTKTGQKIVLVYGKETDDPTSYGEFAYLYDGSTFRIKKDDEFTLPPETERKYKLIDISAQEAQIQDLATGQKIRIGKAE